MERCIAGGWCMHDFERAAGSPLYLHSQVMSAKHTRYNHWPLALCLGTITSPGGAPSPLAASALLASSRAHSSRLAACRRWSLLVLPASICARCRMCRTTVTPSSTSTSFCSVHCALRCRSSHLTTPNCRSSPLLVLASRSSMSSRPNHAQRCAMPM